MEKDKSPILGGGGGGGGGFPPSSSRHAYALPSGGLVPAKCDASSSSSSKNIERFSHDISRMPDYPSRNVGHRRAHSEILSLPDDNNFYSDLGVVGYGEGEGPSLSDETEEDFLNMYLDIDKFASSSALSGLDLSGSGSSMVAEASDPSHTQAENVTGAQNMNMKARHQHTQSMDESTSIKPEALSSGIDGLRDAKKAVSSEKLADLALIDPKRAKRIWANRQSAARSKERKMRYIADLERKTQTLQTEATTMSTQLAILQRDNTGLTAENSELKLRLQTIEQQVHLQDALNDALREEVQRLKIATGQGIPNGGQMMNFGHSFGGVNQQYYHHNHAMQSRLTAHQLQQIQMHPQHQQQFHQHQLQQYQQHSSADLRTRGMMSSQTHRENTSSDACPPQD